MGAESITKQSLGFGQQSDAVPYDKMKENILEAAKKVFRPEFLNRLDEILVFHALSKEDLIKILNLEIEKVCNRLKHRSIELVLDDKARDFLVAKGYDPNYGARPMRRSVERYLEDPLAEEILKGNIHGASPVVVTAGDEMLTFSQDHSDSETESITEEAES